MFCGWLLVALCLCVPGCDRSGSGSSDGLTPVEGLQYSSPVIYAVGTQIPENRPTLQRGLASIYTVTPSLPAGLQLDAATGVVSGTPTATSRVARYTITASNGVYNATANLDLAVLGLQKFCVVDFNNQAYLVDSANPNTAIVLPTGTTSMAVTYGNGRFLVVNRDSNDVTIIDAVQNAVMATVPVGTRPAAAAFGNGKFIVTNEGGNTVTLIDATTNTVSNAALPVGLKPVAAAFGDNLFAVVNKGDGVNPGSVTLIDASSDSVVGIITVGINPIDVVFGHRWFAVLNSNLASAVSLIGSQSKTVEQTVDLLKEGSNTITYGNGYFAVTTSNSHCVSFIAISPDRCGVRRSDLPVGINPISVTYANGYFVVANAISHEISLIDGAGTKVVATEPVGLLPYNVTAGNNRVLVTHLGEPKTYFLDPSRSNPKISGPAISLSYNGDFRPYKYVAFSHDADSSQALCMASCHGQIGLVDAATGGVSKTFSPPKNFSAIASDGLGLVAVASKDANNVTFVDAMSSRLLATVSVGKAPSSIAFGSDRFLVGNSDSNDVTSINAKAPYNILGTKDVSISPKVICFGSGLFAVGGTHQVVLLNATDLEKKNSIDIGSDPIGMAFGNNEFAVIKDNSDILTMLDTNCNPTYITVPPVGFPCKGVAFGLGKFAVAVAKADFSYVVLIASHTPSTPIPFTGDAAAIAYGNSFFGCTLPGGSSVSFIDAVKDVLKCTVAVKGPPSYIDYGDGLFAVGNTANASVTTLDPYGYSYTYPFPGFTPGPIAFCGSQTFAVAGNVEKGRDSGNLVRAAKGGNIAIICTEGDDKTMTVWGQAPCAVKFGNQKFAVAYADSSNLHLIDLAAKTRTMVPVGEKPVGLAFGKNLFAVAHQESQNVIFIDSTSNATVGTVSVSQPCVAIEFGNDQFAVIKGTTKENQKVSFIDANSLTLRPEEVTVGTSSSAIAFGKNKFAVPDRYMNFITLIDAVQHTMITQITVKWQPVAAIFANNRFWIANLISNLVAVIDADTNTLVDEVVVGSLPVALAFGNNRLAVVNSFSKNISILDTWQNKVIATCTPGNNPQVNSAAFANNSFAFPTGSLSELYLYMIDAIYNTPMPELSIDITYSASLPPLIGSSE